MKNFRTIAQRFLREEDGPTAVEYAIMLGLIVVVCVAAIISIGQAAKGVFETVSTSF